MWNVALRSVDAFIGDINLHPTVEIPENAFRCVS